MKIALVGAGKIVLSCLDALKDIEGIDIAALCVRQEVCKRRSIKSQYNIHSIYTDYDLLLQDSNIDFVYLGIPNHLHFSYSHKALSAGKHVICEKPFTSNYAQLLELVTLAKSTGRYLLKPSLRSTRPALFTWRLMSLKLVKLSLYRQIILNIQAAIMTTLTARYIRRLTLPNQAARFTISTYIIFIMSAPYLGRRRA